MQRRMSARFMEALIEAGLCAGCDGRAEEIEIVSAAWVWRSRRKARAYLSPITPGSIRGQKFSHWLADCRRTGVTRVAGAGC